MTAIKSTIGSSVMYAVVDQSSNEVTIRQDGVKLANFVYPTSGAPTVAFWANGTRCRLSQANATAWGASGPAIPSTMYDADANLLNFAPPVTPFYLGGFSEGAASGCRLYFGGVWLDLTAQNLADLGTAMASFASSGVLS